MSLNNRNTIEEKTLPTMIDIEKKAIEYQNQFKVYDKACNYLKNRGFKDKINCDVMIRNQNLGLSLTKGDYYYGYLVFPIVDLQGKIVSFTGRSIMDGVTPLHKHWRGTIDYFYSHVTLKSSGIIYITESPLDTLSLRYAGYSSIATMGSSRLPTNYTDLKGKDVIILFDTDLNNTGQSKAKLLASKIYLICKSVSIARIPLLKGSKKIDVNDLLKSSTTTSDFTRIINLVTSTAILYEYTEISKITPTSTHDFSEYDILKVVSDHLDINQTGNVYRAYCPFHNDSDPSFTVYPETGSYYCFGCEKGGDAVSFLRELMGFEFLEAKEHLEINYG